MSIPSLTLNTNKKTKPIHPYETHFHRANIRLACLVRNLSFISEHGHIAVIDGIKVISEELYKHWNVIGFWNANRPQDALLAVWIIHTKKDALRSNEPHFSVLEPYLNIVRLDVS